MKAPSQDFTVLSRGLFLFSGAFAFTGAQERFSHLGGRLPSHAAKVVLQLAYGGERGACGRCGYSALSVMRIVCRDVLTVISPLCSRRPISETLTDRCATSLTSGISAHPRRSCAETPNAAAIFSSVSHSMRLLLLLTSAYTVLYGTSALIASCRKFIPSAKVSSPIFSPILILASLSGSLPFKRKSAGTANAEAISARRFDGMLETTPCSYL